MCVWVGGGRVIAILIVITIVCLLSWNCKSQHWPGKPLSTVYILTFVCHTTPQKCRQNFLKNMLKSQTEFKKRKNKQRFKKMTNQVFFFFLHQQPITFVQWVDFLSPLDWLWQIVGNWAELLIEEMTWSKNFFPGRCLQQTIPFDRCFFSPGPINNWSAVEIRGDVMIVQRTAKGNSHSI